MADSAAASRGELERRFGGVLGADVLAEALSIMRVYALSPADLFFKWEAFLLAGGVDSEKSNSSTPSLDGMRELRKEIQIQTAATSAAAAHLRRDAAGSSSSSSSGLATPNAGGQSRVKKLGGRAALDGILDGASSTPLAKRGKMGTSSSNTSGSSTFNNGSTPLARTGGAMRPSSLASAASPSSFATPQAASKTAIPSHLSRTTRLDSPQTPSTPSFDSPTQGSSAVRFQDRQNALEIVETLNGHLKPIVGTATDSSMSRIALASNANPKDYIYRYMFEKVTERAAVLDNAIDESADLVMQYYGIEDLGNPEHPSQDDIYCVGRICPEGDGVRLTDTSLHLESSRRFGGGMRVPLRFDPDVIVRASDDPSYSTDEGGVGLFPGMLVGLKGRNPGAGFFTASEILLLPPVDQPQTPVAELINFQHGSAKLDGQPMSVISACGPYTVDDDLSYAPLAALMENAATVRPDLVILLGPFVDSSHPLLKSGDVDQTPQQLFQQVISPKISSLLDYSLNTTVILVPSVRDLISQNVVYPQAPLDREGLGLHKRAKLLPNPATFQVNEIVFAVTSADTFFSLKQNEYFKRAKDASAQALSRDANTSSSDLDMYASSKDVMARMCRHVLRQRSFYPLFPAPSAPPLEPLNLDVTHSDLLRFNEGTGADIFIMPSMLKHFAKVVDSAVMINPASLTRKNQPGTFVKLAIYPTPQRELEEAGSSMEVDDEEDDRSLEHKVYERARVDVVRI